MTRIKIAIVDDNAEDRSRLRSLLREYASANRLDMDIVPFTNGESVLQDFKPYAYAVIFMDIYMDGIDGIETARQIREIDNTVALVVLTTSESHRSDAFSVFATSYLSKPCASAELYRTMDHILRICTDRDKRLHFSYNRADYSLRFSEIVSLETDGNYLSIEDSSGKRYRTRMTIRDAESRLDDRFLKIIQGVIVNMDYVARMNDSCCIMQSGSTLPLHIKHGKKLREQWLNYKFAQIRRL